MFLIASAITLVVQTTFFLLLDGGLSLQLQSEVVKEINNTSRKRCFLDMLVFF
tara:strand:- start:31244 stop:31402 length:159 start_codon:yes stop_codon:yes gene_type:complete